MSLAFTDALSSDVLEAMHQLQISPPVVASDWSERRTDDHRPADWSECPVEDERVPPLSAGTVFPVQFRTRPSDFAVVATDDNFVAGLTDTAWFRCEKSPDWYAGVLKSLKDVGVARVHCCEKDRTFAKVCRGLGMEANVEPYPERYALKYECKICGERDCAVQKAFLSYRRLNKRKPCDLIH